ncbi:MAG TPA: SCO family protein [Polyangia bacterium]
MRRALVAAVLLLASSPLAARSPLQDIDIEEHLGAPLPLALPFVDENGHAARLGDYFRDGKPVVLVLAYLRCPSLCDLVLRGVVDSLARQHLALGRDYRALTVSIDPKDTPAGASLKQHSLLQALGDLDAVSSWPFLTGAESSIAPLAARLGFQYAYDPKSDQYAHPACAFVLTPDGRISRYLYGVKFRPLDVRLALDEAARGKIGGIVDRVLLSCFRYDPATRRYGWYVRGILRGGAALTLVIVGGALGLLWRREWQRRGDA